MCEQESERARDQPTHKMATASARSSSKANANTMMLGHFGMVILMVVQHATSVCTMRM